MKYAKVILAPLAVAVALFAYAGCSSDDSAGNPSRDAGQGDAGLSDINPAPECYEHPTTHEEIINACTDAAKILKNPKLPLLGPNGERPPLP